jgi:hypothetical protein
LGFIPSIAAAPLAPEICQSVASRVRIMCSRSTASKNGMTKPALNL